MISFTSVITSIHVLAVTTLLRLVTRLVQSIPALGSQSFDHRSHEAQWHHRDFDGATVHWLCWLLPQTPD